MTDLVLAAHSRFFSKTQPADDGTGCILWLAARQPNGYGKLGVAYRTVLAHRWIYEQTHNVTLAPDALVLHSCDRRNCVNVDHLRVGTYKDNAADMDARGRRVTSTAKGSEMGASKLTEDTVREARERRASEGATFQALADEYGVSVTAMHLAVTGRSWSHVE